MKKQLNTSSIMNELQGSVFFPTRSPAPLQHKEQPATTDGKRNDPVRDVPPVRPVPVVPLARDVRPVPPPKRMMKQRHPFDIYHDQYETLKQLADEERRQG